MSLHGWLAVLTCLVSCKSGGSEVECGPGTVKRDRRCVVEAPPAPVAAIPDAGARDAEPSCAELCKQLVACKPAQPGRPPLLADSCATRCNDDNQRPVSTFLVPDMHPMGGAPVSQGAEIRRPDCSKGCDDKSCQAAWNWAAEPAALAKPSNNDPLTFTVSGHWLSATNKAPGLARTTFVAHCANPGKVAYPLERVSLWVERGKTRETQIIGAYACGHVFVQIEGALFDDQSMWRPGFGWSCANADGTYAPCAAHKPVAAKP